MMRRVYWWRGRQNVGDALAPILLREFAGVTAEWARLGDADLVTVGSVIQGLPKSWTGTVLGSGRLRPGHTDLSQARVLALRGPLSAPGVDTPYGDPAMLLPLMVERPPIKHTLGVVPHWSDTSLAKLGNHVIDVAGEPLDVVRQIAECDTILTSSLHGAIIAHAYGIPASPSMCPRVMEEGGTFKWRDYYATFGREAFRGSWAPSEDRVREIQQSLLKAYKEVE